MKPRFRSRGFDVSAWFLLGVAVLGVSGCMGPLFRGQEPDDVDTLIDDEPEDDGPRYVGQLTRPWGFEFSKIEGVALVTQLAGTGSDPRPSALREKLAGEMLTHRVADPDVVLGLNSTSMVLVRGLLPPGIEKGERFDVELRVPSKSETTSLEGGYLMRCRLRPVELLGGNITSGHVIGLAQGPLVVDSAFEGEDDDVLATRAHVLGGGIAAISRPFGLHVREKYESIRTSTAIAKAINARFVAGGRYRQRRGAANPKSDKTVEMSAPSQYKNNLGRFVRVVNNLALGETPQDQMNRMRVLERQLLEPSTSAKAALRLEAIGKTAVSTLLSALGSPDREVRFYAAEALAYMERSESVGVLEATAREDSSLRWHALTALSSMDDVEAGAALTNLLESNSAETCYGAFRALRARSKSDPLVRGDVLGDGFSFHIIQTAAEPIIHFARSRGPEIVLFGNDHLLDEKFLYRKGEWVIRGTGSNTVKVSRFSIGSDAKHEICTNRLEDVVRAVDRLGGSYRDLLDLVKEAKDTNRINSRLVINAVPMPHRRYQRNTPAAGADSGGFPNLLAGTPLPELFRDRQANDKPSSGDHPSDALSTNTDFESDKPKPNLLGRIKSWFAG